MWYAYDDNNGQAWFVMSEHELSLLRAQRELGSSIQLFDNYEDLVAAVQAAHGNNVGVERWTRRNPRRDGTTELLPALHIRPMSRVEQEIEMEAANEAEAEQYHFYYITYAGKWYVTGTNVAYHESEDLHGPFTKNEA